jgi:polyhydroxyalkanoate synthase
LSDEDVDRLIEANGNLPGELMSYVFSLMTPGATLSKYNTGLLDTFDDEKKLLNFLRMEKWIADRPHHPGEAAKQLLVNLYKNNELVRGEFELNGRKVDLGNIKVPVLNIYAKDDHIIRPRRRRRFAPSWGPRTTARWGWKAATWASSSAASRKACSARGSSTGCASATDEQRVVQGLR